MQSDRFHFGEKCLLGLGLPRSPSVSRNAVMGAS